MVTLVAVLAAFAVAVKAQPAASSTANNLAARNFPFLTRLAANSRLAGLLQADAALLNLTKVRSKRLQNALEACPAAGCYTNLLSWTPEEVNSIGNELVKLYPFSPALRDVAEHLYKSGEYRSAGGKSDTALLRQAWITDAKGINRILAVYLSGQKPTYARIDSISFAPGDAHFLETMRNALKSRMAGAGKSAGLFFELPLYAAATVLELNGRDEAVRYLPLTGGANGAPRQRVRKTDWKKYPYSAILVPGLGPELPGQNLDPGGAARCVAGAQRLKNGLAPFIIVSGGHVHPYKTPFNEAIEMKKYLVDKLNVPADAIIVEPHARHTTTNLRNANRLVYQFGIPANKPILIVSDSSQINYIGKGMEKVALRDLGYQPHQQLKQLNDHEVSYYPNRESLQVNSTDPLDPQ